MKNELPLVSVVMPNYNTPEVFLRAAIESILEQTYQNIEFIIIDDASTEDDVQIIKSYADDRIILIQNENNKHVSYTLNRGLEIARGTYIARMDSDDVSLPKRIAKQVRFLQKHSDIDVLATQAEIIGDRKGVFATNLKDAKAMKIAIFFNCPIVNPSVLFRATFINDNALRYRTDLEYKAAEDYEFWSRCVSLGQLYEYSQVLLKYRTHAKQVSSKSSTTQIDSANRVRKKMLAALGITPNTREMDIHYQFCTESILSNIALKDSEDWAMRLIAGNAKFGIFDTKRFNSKATQHFFIIAVKSLLAKEITLAQFIKCRLTVKALSPKYYASYINRYLYSRKLNR